jgi:hypothetical protein
LFALLQGWFKKKKKIGKVAPENWKIREKLKVLFSVGTAVTIWPIFFLIFVIIRMRFLCKEKLEKLPGKLENSGKKCFFVVDMHNSFFVLFVIVVKKFSEKKIRTITKKSRKIRANSNAFSIIITDDRNDIFH